MSVVNTGMLLVQMLSRLLLRDGNHFLEYAQQLFAALRTVLPFDWMWDSCSWAASNVSMLLAGSEDQHFWRLADMDMLLGSPAFLLMSICRVATLRSKFPMRLHGPWDVAFCRVAAPSLIGVESDVFLSSLKAANALTAQNMNDARHYPVQNRHARVILDGINAISLSANVQRLSKSLVVVCGARRIRMLHLCFLHMKVAAEMEAEILKALLSLELVSLTSLQ